jgi:hypothetical protein
MALKDLKMPMMTEDERTSRPIVTTREPKGPVTAGSKGSLGDIALRDAITIVCIAWVIVFFFAFSLRRHNV